MQLPTFLGNLTLCKCKHLQRCVFLGAPHKKQKQEGDVKPEKDTTQILELNFYV